MDFMNFWLYHGLIDSIMGYQQFNFPNIYCFLPSRMCIYFSECFPSNVIVSTVNNGEINTENFRLVSQFSSNGTFGILCEKGNSLDNNYLLIYVP